MDYKRFLLALTFIGCGSTSASTVFSPTDGNVNFLNQTIVLDSQTQLAMFNVGDLGGTSKAIILDNSRSSAVAAFSPVLANWNVDIKPSATSGTVFDSMTLLGSDNFILGLTKNSGGSWAMDTGATDMGGDIFKVSFSDGSVLQIDVGVVPLPAAIWLLGSGIVGLGLIGRRRGPHAT